MNHKRQSLSASLTDILRDKRPNRDDMLFFADESRVKLTGRKPETVVGLSGVTVEYFLSTNPKVFGPLSHSNVLERGREVPGYIVMNDGLLYDNMSVMRADSGSGSDITETLGRLMTNSYKQYKKRRSESKIVAYLLCNSFHNYVDDIYSIMEEKGCEKIPTIITVGGTISWNADGTVEMRPHEYKFKQIVGIYSRIKYHRDNGSFKQA